MLQSMGVIVLEERPFTVTRPDGLPVWIYQFKISVFSDIPDEPEGPSGTRPRCGSPMRSPRSGTAAPRSTGSTSWCCAPPDVAAGRDSAHLREVPAAGRFSVQPGPYRGRAQRQPGTARSLVELFEAMFDPAADPGRNGRAGRRRISGRRYRCADQFGHRLPWRPNDDPCPARPGPRAAGRRPRRPARAARPG